MNNTRLVYSTESGRIFNSCEQPAKKCICKKIKSQADKKIDGISGATLSVNAVEKLARLALLLHQHSGIAESK